MEDSESAETFKQLERVDLIFEKVKHLDILPDMVKAVQSLQDDVKAVWKFLSFHQKELDKVHKRQNELEQELQIVRNLSQRHERDSNLEERLDLYVQDIHDTLNYHQGFIESVDRQFRGKNLIFHGVPENTSVELGSNDIDKIKNVIQKTGLANMGGIDNSKIKRLGEIKGDQDKPRPILVKVENHEIQKQLLMKAKQLKNQIGCSRIYIKKDLHYTVRKELNRLKTRERQEKDNARNKEVDIKFDWKERVLKINGMIVDRYKPSF